jgi:hypothetical protein
MCVISVLVAATKVLHASNQLSFFVPNVWHGAWCARPARRISSPILDTALNAFRKGAQEVLCLKSNEFVDCLKEKESSPT